jgi:superfamily I DNA/RNA helicase
VPECAYREKEVPSSVVPVECPSFKDQIQAITDRLNDQFSLYPGELIGVLFPKREQVAEFVAHAQRVLALNNFARLRIETLHAAKGWEFRAVHIGGCEVLPRMGAIQKRLIYTGILRGKTSVTIYFSGRLPGYLSAALAVLDAPKPDPTMESLF